MIKQVVLIILFSTVIGLGVNLLSPNKIPYIGQYRELSSGNGPIVPPSAMEDDPPFIAIDVAHMEYSMGDVLFIDSREYDEFVCGTIPGSINIPFEYMPEENLDIYLDSCLNGAPKNLQMIIFCSGEECDLSLHLARNLQALNYTKLAIFFGGSREWEKFGLEIERRKNCEE